MGSAGKTSSRSSGASPAEAPDPVLAALGRIESRLDHLETRLERMECVERVERVKRTEHTERAPPPPPIDPQGPERAPEEREGTFGPAIKRTDSSRHRDAVGRALSMLGIVPEPAPDAGARRKLTNEHAKAVARMKRLSGHEAPDPPATHEAVESSGPSERSERSEPSDPSEATVAVAPDPDALVPLPEIVARAPRPEREVDDTAGTDTSAAFDGVLPIHLGDAPPVTHARGVMLLALELAGITTLLLWLPGPLGVLAGIPVIALLAAPIWGASILTLRAHARFLTLVLLARCLAPDMLMRAMEPAWNNLRFAAMLGACLPATIVVLRTGVGFWVMAIALSLVLGGAVGAEAVSPVIGTLSGLLALAICAFIRERRVRGAPA